jgi:RimJ/RimL family protein N-acetyltransferase
VLDHLAELCAMHCDPRVMATIGGVRSYEATRDYLAANLNHWERHGYGLWVLRDQAGRFLGRAGVNDVNITCDAWRDVALGIKVTVVAVEVV